MGLWQTEVMESWPELVPPPVRTVTFLVPSGPLRTGRKT